MSIRIGITDGNRTFFERFRTAFRERFGEEFEIYLFPDLERALTAVERFHIQVVLLEDPEGQYEDLSSENLPETAFFARLCNKKQEEKEWERQQKGVPLLCRYRSAEDWRELLLRELEARSETGDKAAKSGSFEGTGSETRERCQVVLFTSAAGGTGASTAARGFAEFCRRRNRSVLYLDLQTFPERRENYVTKGPEDDLYTLEDVVLSLRGRRFSPDAVVERSVRTTETGLRLILPPENPSSLFDLTGEEIVTLLDLLCESGKFTMIILDMNFDPSERIVLPFLSCDRIVFVSDGAPIANRKTEQLMTVLPSLSAEAPSVLWEKYCLLYNRFRQGRSRAMNTEKPCKLGGIRELELTAAEDLENEISYAPAMERLYEVLTR